MGLKPVDHSLTLLCCTRTVSMHWCDLDKAVFSNNCFARYVSCSFGILCYLLLGTKRKIAASVKKIVALSCWSGILVKSNDSSCRSLRSWSSSRCIASCVAIGGLSPRASWRVRDSRSVSQIDCLPYATFLEQSERKFLNCSSSWQKSDKNRNSRFSSMLLRPSLWSHIFFWMRGVYLLVIL